MSTISATTLPHISPRRRRTDKIMRGLLAAGTGIALVPLILVVYDLLQNGLGQWSGELLHDRPDRQLLREPRRNPQRAARLDRDRPARHADRDPGRHRRRAVSDRIREGRRFAKVVRYFVDVMTGVPSIMFGLFIYITLVLAHVGGNFTGWKGSIALALLMLPIVIRSSEVVLNLVPGQLREAALALGAPRWRVVSRVVLPTATPGLVTGCLLAIARGMGETAPLLFTVATATTLTYNLGSQMNTLPVLIYTDIQSPRQAIVDRAWGAALTLVAFVLILNVIARIVSRRSRMG